MCGAEEKLMRSEEMYNFLMKYTQLKKWKIVKSVDISPSKWYPLQKHTVELPDGRIVEDYFVSHMDDVVMVVPILATGEIVLVKQYKHGIQDIMIELPAGYIQKGKTPTQSAIAELHEETGIKIAESRLMSLGKIASSPGKSLQVVHMYLAVDLNFNSAQMLDPNESIEVLPVSYSALQEMITSGVIWTSGTLAAIQLAQLKYPQYWNRIA